MFLYFVAVEFSLMWRDTLSRRFDIHHQSGAKVYHLYVVYDIRNFSRKFRMSLDMAKSISRISSVMPMTWA